MSDPHYDAAQDFVDDWLAAPSDAAARFVCHAGLERAWQRLTRDQRAQLRAVIEPQISDPLRADELASLPQ